VMVNCNPETVSTDYDTADRLYFEPLTFEDVLEVVEAERAAGPVAGVICTLGGQTPLGLAQRLKDAGVPVLGTAPEAIDAAEHRGSFSRVLADTGLPAPAHGTATTFAEAREIAARIGYPVLVRPSYVLGGRGMEIVYDDATLEAYIAKATDVSPEHPVLVDRFLEDAVEIDVDALFDGSELYLGGVMEHIEEAGIHSGDSACALPPITLGSADLVRIRAATEKLAARIGVRGLVNVQYAIKDDILFVIEANPRASRTVPFVSKATAVQLAKAAARIAVGESIAELRTAGVLPPSGDGADLPEDAPIAVKEAVLPFHRFRTVDGQNVDTVLGPEMKSTGEVMGLDTGFGTAFAKSQAAAYGGLPTEGTVFVSLANRDKRSAIFPVKRLADLGFRVLATTGTAQVLRRNGVACEVVGKYSDGPGNVVERITAGDVDIVVNTPFGAPGNSGPRLDGYEIRTAAVSQGVPCITTVQGLAAVVQAVEALRRGDVGVRSLQEVHAALADAQARLPPVPYGRRARRGHRAVAGDEVHRRGHGPGRRVRHRVRQVAGRRLRLAADSRDRLRLAGQPGQALGSVPDQAAGRPRFPGAGHRRHRAGAAAQRGGLRGGRQVQRGPRQRGREDPGRRGRHRRQHPLRVAGQQRPAAGRLRDPHGGSEPGRPVHHDRAGDGGRRPGHRGAAR